MAFPLVSTTQRWPDSSHSSRCTSTAVIMGKDIIMQRRAKMNCLPRREETQVVPATWSKHLVMSGVSVTLQVNASACCAASFLEAVPLLHSRCDGTQGGHRPPDMARDQCEDVHQA